MLENYLGSHIYTWGVQWQDWTFTLSAKKAQIQHEQCYSYFELYLRPNTYANLNENQGPISNA